MFFPTPDIPRKCDPVWFLILFLTRINKPADMEAATSMNKYLLALQQHVCRMPPPSMTEHKGSDK